jgi:uncharacterized protein
MRIVLDANIYASALMKSEGPPGLLLRTLIEGGQYELVFSQAILDEVRRILFYPKIRTKIKKTDLEVDAWLDALSLFSHFVVPRHSYPLLVREDPDDDIYIIAALESHADYIVSGDQHLLKMKAFEAVKIVTAVEFIKTQIWT